MVESGAIVVAMFLRQLSRKHLHSLKRILYIRDPLIMQFSVYSCRVSEDLGYSKACRYFPNLCSLIQQDFGEMGPGKTPGAR